MIELKRSTFSSQAAHDLGQLRERASYRRQRFRHDSIPFVQVQNVLASLRSSSPHIFQSLPQRYLLHMIVALLIPLAFVLGHLATQPAPDMTSSQAIVLSDSPLGLGPISLDLPETQVLEGDPPLENSDALPVPISLTSRSEALAPLTVPAIIAGDVVKLRDGPGLEYDDVARITGDTPINVIGRRGEWLQIRELQSNATYWVAGELVDIPVAAIYALFEVRAEDIPPPPPPKVGFVREDHLNLRDGPGTNYVSMIKLNAGQELTLIEQYQDWLHVASGDTDGWVKGEFLDIGPGVMHRVHVSETIPDPNPPLVGMVNENSVNLRKGPGTAYSRINSVDAGIEVDLLARHDDWFKVQLGDGSKAWIFADLLNITPMAARRVSYTNDIPALPANIGGGGGGGSAVHIPASGDIASFATQFVGYRYVYGGSSPSSGFDCSGLTSYVYRQFGVYLPHSSRAQYSTAYGAMVGGMNNLAPGDLMFFVNTSGRGISHVAIYIGGGRMVHAMMPGYGVQVSNIWSGYWQSHYYGAIRVRR